MWKFLASQKQWDIAIVVHADPGRAGQSMLLRFGKPTSCESLRGRNILPRFKRQISVSDNTAENAVATL